MIFDQVSLEYINKLDIDLFICSSGFEERSSFLAKNIKANIKRGVVFSFTDKDNVLHRKNNDKYFEENGFEKILIDGDDDDLIRNFFYDTEKSITVENYTVLIDYSSMTRIWYSKLLSLFYDYRLKKTKINLFFSYSLAQYSSPKNLDSFNIHIGPIRGFSSISVPQKPTALIIGLGYEGGKALGLYEYFDGETFIFIADNSTSSDYYEEVIKNNEGIIKQAKNIYYYSLKDVKYSFELLHSLVKDLSNEYRVIIAPCGPKIFTFLSLLQFFEYEQVDIWRISSGKEAKPEEKIASGEVVIAKVLF